MKSLFRRIREKLGALELSLSRRRDKAQTKLLRDLIEAVSDLEVEIYLAIDEPERRKLCVDQE
jgi:transcription antitermination factor NusA-like protein